MDNSAILWLFLNAFSIIVLGFYSMMEMACVSFNKVRLQYYVSKEDKRAIWLNYLLQHPSRLFGTTLIGVNIALVVGSECARQFYSSIGFSPDLAPITQVIIVVIFGELAPMFAARHYAENVALLGVPLIYASAKVMTPLLWIVDLVSKLCNFIIGGKENPENIYLTQEELQNILDEKGEGTTSELESAEFSAIAANIFNLRGRNIRQIMEPLNHSLALPSNATIEQMEVFLRKTGAIYVPLYSNSISNVIAIAYPRDVLRASPSHRVRNYARPPWFVSETATLMQILKQFRTNNENVAVILNHKGKAIGLVELDDVLEEIFGKAAFVKGHVPSSHRKKLMLIDKTFPGNTTIEEFNKQFNVVLGPDPKMTLADLMADELEHKPERGESIYLPPFEFTVKDSSLMDVRTISVSTRGL